MKKDIYYDVILSNGFTDVYLGLIHKTNLEGFQRVLSDFCYFYNTYKLYNISKDLPIVCDFLLNTFGVSLSEGSILTLKRICKTPFFIRIVKLKKFVRFNDEK